MAVAPRIASVLFAAALGACGVKDEVVRLDDAGGRATTNAGLDVDLGRSGGGDEVSPRILRRFAAIDAPSHAPSPRVDLGRVLYFEPLLSRTGKVSCNTCHPLDAYGTTATARSKGVDGLEGKRNAPTTYNAAGSFRQFWDGRAETLEEQAKGPMLNPVEMDMPPDEVEKVLRAIPGYAPLFAAAFPEAPAAITFDQVALAIAEFERGLLTPSRWDRYLGGDTGALTADEKAGVKLFANLGCIVCHTGPYLGGNMFEKLGVHAPWPHSGDRGRREVSSNPADDMVFKVPTMRNVTRTAPYFHDGTVSDLGEAIRIMGRLQVAMELTDEETRLIVAWCASLTGEIPADYVKPPVLPAAHRP